MKPRHIKGLFSFLLVLTMAMVGCKKDEPAESVLKELYGTWEEDVLYNPALKLSRGLMFSRDSIYFTTWDFTKNQVTYVNGTYVKQGDRIITDFKVIEVRQNNNLVISRMPVSSNYFNNATFKLDEYKLTINYTGNPSANSLPATIIFNRRMPD